MVGSALEKNSLELAHDLGMETLETIPLDDLPRDQIKTIPYAFAKRHCALPIRATESTLTVAIADPLNLEAIDDVRIMCEKHVDAVYAPEEKILEALNYCYHQDQEEASQLIANLSEGNGSSDEEDVEVYDLLDTKDEAPIIRLLNLILSEAINQGASDIHFEPFENDLKVRYRIDGVLQPRHFPAREHQAQLLTRIKVLAKLDIAEHRLPQDGRIKLRMGGREIDFRVSTVPISHGERIVLRILDKGNIVLGLEKLGMLPAILDNFRSLITQSEGIILVTGPTGSGKTTTLYSALWEIFSEELNIMTIEDPVEYKLKGIAQIGVRPKIGLNFAAGLRHILRQDPDVVMVGEIRDTETAEIAIQAALTGHLVFSTLHTNDAPSAIPRLADMNIEPYLLSSSLIGVLAQRLVRTVCPECREGYIPSDTELEELSLDRSQLSAGMIYRGKGCASCFESGYKGRHGIYELLPVDSSLQTVIATEPSASTLRESASQKGFVTLRQHGAHLVRSGVTTVAEVLRATRKH